MFDWMLPEKHAIAILKKDHDTVKGLFEEFEKAETAASIEKTIDSALNALRFTLSWRKRYSIPPFVRT